MTCTMLYVPYLMYCTPVCLESLRVVCDAPYRPHSHAMVLCCNALLKAPGRDFGRRAMPFIPVQAARRVE